MKYITTDKHPELKEGIMLEYSTHGQQYYTGSNMYHATHHQVKALLEKGYIKEVEEKEFTKSDMISLAGYISNNCNSDDHELLFYNWLKETK